MIAYDYQTAFARNIGLVSASEQEGLRNTCVALAGLGGVGSAHLQALARLGLSRFNLADPDTFDLVNIQRQLGASMQTLGQLKVEASADAARAINPDVCVRTYPEGIQEKSIDAFLKDADVVIDGVDFFCMEIRRMLHRACHQRRIPIVMAGPIGYGAAVLVFTPGGMSFDEYFHISDDQSRVDQLLAFGLGLGPGLAGDIDPSRVDFKHQKGPALITACLLCAAITATEVLKLVTGRGRVQQAPHGLYWDLLRAELTPLRRAPAFDSPEGRQLRTAMLQRFPELQLEQSFT